MLDAKSMMVEWKQDAFIDQNNLLAETTKSQQLHAKYLDYYLQAKKALFAADAAVSAYRAKKTKYWQGKMTSKELLQEGWEQWQYAKPLKSELDDMFMADQSYQLLMQTATECKDLVFACEKILDSVGKRDFAITNATKLILYSNGLN